MGSEMQWLGHWTVAASLSTKSLSASVSWFFRFLVGCWCLFLLVCASEPILRVFKAISGVEKASGSRVVSRVRTERVGLERVGLGRVGLERVGGRVGLGRVGLERVGLERV
jgi:hypothetical protein